MTALDAQAVKAAVSIEAVIRPYTDLKRKGEEFVGLCPFHSEKTPSFYVVPTKGMFHCFGCGASGDVLEFVMRAEKIDFRAAVLSLVGDVHGRVAHRAPDPAASAARRKAEERETRSRVKMALDLWRGARNSIDGTPAETYLRSRGIRRPHKGWPRSLRFDVLRYAGAGEALNGERLPVLLAGLQIDCVIGVHRTYLAPGGTGKAAVATPKKMLGLSAGAAIRFAPPGPHVMVAEGIETALSVRQARPRRRVWAAGSLGNMARLVLPPCVKRITLCMDSDGKDPATAKRVLAEADERYRRAGVRVFAAWPPAGMDFNDVLEGRA